MRIYEFAKQHKVESKDIKQILDQLGIVYKTHTSAIPADRLSEVEAKISGNLLSISSKLDLKISL